MEYSSLFLSGFFLSKKSFVKVTVPFFLNLTNE